MADRIRGRTFTASRTGAFTLASGGTGVTARHVGIDRVVLAETSAVPEPATGGIMLIGFLGIDSVARRCGQAGSRARSARKFTPRQANDGEPSV